MAVVTERGVETPGGPVEPGLPAGRLALGEVGWSAGAVAEEIGLGIALDLGDGVVAAPGQLVGHGAGEPGDAHALRPDGLALRRPFTGNGLSQGRRRQGQEAAAGRADRPAVEHTV